MSRTTHLLAFALLVSSAACLGGSIPAPELYRLSPTRDGSDSAALTPGPLSGALAIDRYATPGVYGERGIVYRVGETRYGVYPNREWAVPLAEMLGQETEDVLRRSPLTTERAIFDPDSRRGMTYVWRGTVRQFEEADRGRQVFAVVELDARLVRLADDSVVWSGTRHVEREVPEQTMPAIVGALSELATQAIAQLATDAKSAAERSALRGRQASP